MRREKHPGGDWSLQLLKEVLDQFEGDEDAEPISKERVKNIINGLRLKYAVRVQSVPMPEDAADAERAVAESLLKLTQKRKVTEDIWQLICQKYGVPTSTPEITLIWDDEDDEDEGDEDEEDLDGPQKIH